jgi:hypothetical protein
MFVLKTLIDKYLHKKEKLFACFVDFRKAFDTVAHTAIYLKLLDMNVGGLFYNLIKDMHKISAVCVKVGQNLTHPFFAKKKSRESNLDCNSFCELDRRITSSAYKRQSILLLLI